MEEASGATRLDEIGSEDLSDVGTIGQGTSSDRLYTAGAAGSSLKLSGSRTFCFWYQHETTPTGSANGRVIGVDDLTNREYEITRSNSNNMGFFTWDNSLNYKAVYANKAWVDETWYFVVAYYDQTNKEIGLSIDNGAFSTGAIVDATMNTSTSEAFEMGGVSGSSARWLSGNLDEIGVWSRVLPADEISWLYNGGLGRAFSELI
jgi:uncharacterized protein YaiE (UPF0345 family)